mgnify:FL=1
MSRDILKADPVLREAWPRIKAEYERRHPGRVMSLSHVDRTPAEQLNLFCIGRTEPGDRVTYRDGYNNLSKHNAIPSQAIDVFVKVGGKTDWGEEVVKDIGEIIFHLGYSGELTWGGSWRKTDMYHVEVR